MTHSVKIYSLDTTIPTIKFNKGSLGSVDKNNTYNIFLPNDGWFSDEERANKIFQKQIKQRHYGKDVFVFDLGIDFLNKARDVALPALLESINDLNRNDVRKKAVQKLKTILLSELDTRFNINFKFDDYCATDLTVHQPSLNSTAYNWGDKIYMGLHIDNRQRFGILDREKSNLLLSVNIGNEERYFNFVDIDILGLAKLCKYSYETNFSTVDLKDFFLKSFPDYPVTRILLYPGQGYICNTENIIHDGATNLNSIPDITFMMTGKIS